jgi:hypothetical protein
LARATDEGQSLRIFIRPRGLADEDQPSGRMPLTEYCIRPCVR